MLFRGTRGRPRLAGCLVDSGAARIIEVDRTDQGAHRIRRAVRALPETEAGGDAAIGETLAGLARSVDFTADRVTTCFVGREVSYHTVTLPAMPIGEAEQAARWQIARKLGCAAEGLCVSVADGGPDGSAGRPEPNPQRPYLAAAVASEHVTAAARSFAASPLALVAIDTQPCAVARCLTPRSREEGRLLVVINDDSTLLALLHGATPRIVKCANLGIDQVVAQAARVLDPAAGTHGEAGLRRRLLVPPMPHDEGQTEADQAIGEALTGGVEMLARELTQQMVMFLHHAERTAVDIGRPADACVVADAGVEPAVIEAVVRVTGLPTMAAHDALRPELSAILESDPGMPDASGPSTLARWITPLGLALYPPHEHSGRAAA